MQTQELGQGFLLELFAFTPIECRHQLAVARSDGNELRQNLRHLLVPLGRFGFLGQQEPVEAVGRQGKHIGQIADRRESRPAAQLDGYSALETRQIDFDRLRCS